MSQKARALFVLEMKRVTIPGLHAVGNVAGLLLRADKSGAPSWILRYSTARVRQCIETVRAWTTAHGHLNSPNPAAWAAWKGSLDAMLRASAKIKKKTHHQCSECPSTPRSP